MPVDVDGCFLFIGYLPNTGIFKDLIELDNRGYILTNEDMETNVPGIFAAGDVRHKTLRQVSTSVGDGAVAGYMAERYVDEINTLKNGILRDGTVLCYFYNASEANDRNCLTLIEDYAKKNNEKLALEVIDVYKSDKLQKMLGAPDVPSVMVFRNGEKIFSAPFTDSVFAEIDKL